MKEWPRECPQPIGLSRVKNPTNVDPVRMYLLKNYAGALGMFGLTHEDRLRVKSPHIYSNANITIKYHNLLLLKKCGVRVFLLPEEFVVDNEEEDDDESKERGVLFVQSHPVDVFRHFLEVFAVGKQSARHIFHPIQLVTCKYAIHVIQYQYVGFHETCVTWRHAVNPSVRTSL